MNTLSDEERLQMLKNMVFIGIISAENEEYTEEVKQEVLSRFHKQGGKEPLDWSIILEPLGEDKYKYMKILCEK